VLPLTRINFDLENILFQHPQDSEQRVPLRQLFGGQKRIPNFGEKRQVDEEWTIQMGAGFEFD